MRPQAHIAASLLVWSSAPDAPAWEAPVDVLAGNLPDLDRNVAKALGVKRRDHHRWPTHSLVFWLAPTLLLARHRKARRPLAALWLHLVLDSYADGIAWLWPLHKDKIGLFQGPPTSTDRGWRTQAPIGTKMGNAELGMWLGAVLALARRGRP